jgi:hypothetical protein
MSNLITNPDFEVNTTGWSVGSGYTISRDTTRFHSGVASLKNIAGANGAPIAIGWKAASFGSLALTNGQSYKISIQVYIPSSWASGQISVALWDFTANVARATPVNANMALTDQWQRVDVIATANTSTNQGIRIQSSTATVLNDAFWVDDASLEIRHVIGNTTQGSTLDSGYGGYKSASPVQMSVAEDGSLDAIALWMKITGAATLCRAMVYADNAGVPGALLGTSDDQSIPISDGKQTFNFTTPVSLLAGVTYWLCVGFDSGGGTVAVYCSPSGTGKHDYTANSTATNPFGTATVAGSAGQMSISAYYVIGATLTFPDPNSVILDNFNRANGAAGSDWGAIDPGYPLPLISSNQMAGTDSHSGYWNHAMPNDQEVYLHLTTAMSANDDYVLMTRITGALPTTSENGYCAYFDTTSVTIKRSDAGVKTVLGTFAVAPGAWIGMRATGNVIRAFTSSDGITWTLVGTVIDSTYASGKIGWFINSFVTGTAFSLDDFGGTLAIVFVSGSDSNGTTTETGTQTASAVSPYVKEVGKATDHIITLTVPISAAPDGANTLVMRIGFRASGTATITSITDTKGNTWSVDVENDLSNGHAAVASTKQDVGALTVADSVTITFSATPSNGAAAIIDEFAGIDNSGARVGQTATGTGTGTTRSAGTTATTPTADEIVISAYAGNGAEASLTEDAAFSPFTTDALTYGTTAFVSGEYRVVAATGAYSAPAVGTFSGSTSGAMVTYKLAPVGNASKSGTDSGSGAQTGSGSAKISATDADAVVTENAAMVSASVSGTVLTLTLLEAVKSATLEPTLFSVTDNGTPITVTAAVANGDQTITLTLASAPAGTVLVSYANPYTPAPPAPPSESNYVIPAGATVVTTQAQLETELAKGVAEDIKVMNGTYNRTAELVPAAAHRIWCQSATGVVFNYGLRFNNLSGWEVHGGKFQIPDAAHAATDGGATAAILNWIGSNFTANAKVTDVTVDGASLITQGVRLGQPGGATVQRIKVTNVTDIGVRLSDNSLTSTAVINTVSDIDVAGVMRATRGASDGTGEAGIWIGHPVTNDVVRIKVRETGWTGVWAGNKCATTDFTDLDCDAVHGVVPAPETNAGSETGTAMYVERNTHTILVDRFAFGQETGDIYHGFNGEWNGGTAGNAAMNTFTAKHGRVKTGRSVSSTTPRYGFFGDQGSDDLSVSETQFEACAWACIGYYLTVNTSLADFFNNDFSQRGSGVRITTDHANDPVSAATEVGSDQTTTRPLTLAAAGEVRSFSGVVAAVAVSPLKSGSDSGSGSQTATPVSRASVTDTGSGTNTGVDSVLISGTADTDTESETGVSAGHYVNSDSNSESESSVMKTNETGSDINGTTTQAGNSSARVTGSDSGGSIEDQALKVNYVFIDFNGSGENAILGAVLPASDASVASGEVGALALNYILTDSGGDAEVGFTSISAMSVLGTDAGTSTATGVVRFVFIASDSRVGSDASGLVTKANASDAAGGSESTNRGQEVVEAGSGSETSTQASLWLSSDSGSSLDTAVYVASLISAELASLVEDGTISVSYTVDDSGDGEAEAIFGFSADDAGSGSDVVFIVKLFVGDEFGIGTEAFQIHKSTQFPERPPQIITATEMADAVLVASGMGKPSLVGVGSNKPRIERTR